MVRRMSQLISLHAGTKQHQLGSCTKISDMRKALISTIAAGSVVVSAGPLPALAQGAQGEQCVTRTASDGAALTLRGMSNVAPITGDFDTVVGGGAPGRPLLSTGHLNTKIADRDDVSVSPDGRLKVLVRHYLGNKMTEIYLDDHGELVKVQVFLHDIGQIAWLSDNKSIVYLAQSNDGYPTHLYRTDLLEKQTRNLTPFAWRIAMGFYLSRDRKKVFALIDLKERGVFDVYEVDPYSGLVSLAAAPSRFPEETIYKSASSDKKRTAPNEVYWEQSPDGSTRVKVQIFDQNSSLYAVRTGRPQVIATFPGKISKMLWLSDNKTPLFLAREGSSNGAIHLYKMTEAGWLCCSLTPFVGRNARAFYLSPDRKKIFVQVELNARNAFDLYEINPETRQLTLVQMNPPKLPDDAVCWTSQSAAILSGLNPIPNQAAIYAKNAATIEDIVEFVDPDSPHAKHSETRFTYKPWTEQEKTVFMHDWRLLARRAPGLLLRAGHGHHIYIMRATKLPVPTFIQHAFHNDGPNAQSGNMYMTLTDVFFDSTQFNQVSSVAHELTHLADSYYHLSSSKEWVAMIKPKILAFNQAQNFNKDLNVASLTDYNAWPYGLVSTYSGANMSEALCDSVSRYVADGEKLASPINGYVVNEVLNPDSKAAQIEKKMVEACILARNGEAARAVDMTLAVSKEEPDYIGSYYYCIWACYPAKRPQVAYEQAQKMIDLVNERGLLKTDHLYSMAYYYAALAARDAHEYSKALSWIDEALVADPDSKTYALTKNHLQRMLVPRAQRQGTSATSPAKAGASARRLNPHP